MKILCVFGEHNYGRPARGTSYEYSNFIPALRNLGHAVIHFESWNRDLYQDFASLNWNFLKCLERERPDVVFCVLLHYELWTETLQEVRKRCGTLLVNWGTDDSWKYGQFARWVAPQFDVYATTSPDALRRAQRHGLHNFRLSQWAANSAYLREPLRASECRYPVSFIGSAYGNRPRWIAGLNKSGIQVACFGYGWESGPVDSREIPEIIRQSAISLNFSDSGIVLNGAIPSRAKQIKARVFEVPGAGGFLLTEQAPLLGDFYVPGREVSVFTGLEDLSRQIRRFASDPGLRDAIALAGYRRTVSDHTYEHRFAELLDSCTRLPTPRLRLPAETGNLFNTTWFDAVARRHRLTAGLSLLKRILVGMCSILWGPARGAPAARRMVFELSWRILRGRTYSAGGLPGRMFYRES